MEITREKLFQENIKLKKDIIRIDNYYKNILKDYLDNAEKLMESNRLFFRQLEFLFFKSIINQGDLVFDVGANHGAKTEHFLSYGAKVIAIEPQDNCLRILREKYSNNSNVVVIGNGLSSRMEKKTMLISKNDIISTFNKKWKTGRFSNGSWDSEQKVDMITLEYLIKQYGVPKFCKIDVEGYEYEVIKGLKSKIKIICFEFSEEFFDDALKIIHYLLIIGYKKFNFVNGDNPFFANNNWLEKNDFVKTMNIDPERKSFWGDIYAK